MGQSRVFRLRAAALKNSGFFKVLLLLTLAGVSSFVSATIQPPRLYSPTTTQWATANTSWYPDAASACAADTSLESYRLGSAWSYNGYQCVAEDRARGGYITIGVSSSVRCPENYIRDASKVSTDAQACYYDPPPVEDCSDKIGQSDTVMLKCYEATCPGGWVQDQDGKVGCDGGAVFVAQTLPAAITVAGCPALFANMNGVGPKIKLSAVGSSTPQDIFCNVTYIVTGEAPSSTDPPPSPPAAPPASDLADPGTGTGGAAGAANQAAGGSSDGGTSAGQNGDGSGTAGALGSPCIPTATTPCTGSGIACVPTVQKPCTSTGSGAFECIPTALEPCTGTGGSTTAACETSPVCTGDGIQCAQVLQTWKSVCELNRSVSYFDPADKTGLDAKVTAAESDLSARQTTVDTEAQGLLSRFQTATSSTSTFVCLSDINIHVLSAYVIIPLSKLCEILGLIRILIQVSAYFVAARIIFGAF